MGLVYQSGSKEERFLIGKSTLYLIEVALTVASSEQDAMMSSLNGFHLMSRTGPECPHTFGALMSMRPVYNNIATVNTILILRFSSTKSINVI